MTTTIKSTELDFETIKNNLKTHLTATPEFKDYNFEASGLSALLDVLAYNTHYNSLLANFALNESFLATAQLRSSLVSLAGALGYTVGSRTASCAIINAYVTNPLNPSSMTLPKGFKFSASVSNKTYIFKTRETLIATNDGSNDYYFRLGENKNVVIYEGTASRKIFIAGVAGENQSYVIPTINIDLKTVQVKVYSDVSTERYDVYTNINNAVNIDKNSRIFVIKEAPNGQYELTFGNGARLGIFPLAGNKIEIEYDSVAGPDANGARTFSPVDSILDGNAEALTLNITTKEISVAGSNKEGIESIRKNAPYLYAAQNRMVTAQDYRSLVLREYPNVIDEVKSWGGEENLPPKYGSVFLSIIFKTQSEDVKTATKNGITNLAKNLSVASFDIKFTDPVTTYLQVRTTFQWNPNLTSSSQTSIEDLVSTTVVDYFSDQLGGFDKSFRRSNMLTRIDDCDPSVLNSKTEITMQYRFIPVVGKKVYEISFPTAIQSPADNFHIVTSENFNLNGKISFLRNRLQSSVIEVVDVATGNLILDNIGEYNAAEGKIVLNEFSGTIVGSASFIKILAFPANQSTVNALRNNVLAFDNNASTAQAILTTTI